MRTATYACVLVGFCLLAPALAGAAERVSLNGQWEVQRSEAQTPDGLTGEYKAITIPGVFDAHDRRFAWCRRSFTVPQAWRGKHVFVHFDGVRYAPVVYVNGKVAGSYWGAWEPFEFDVTDLCNFGGKNELMLRISADVQPYLDAGIAFKPDWTLVQRIRDKVVVPMGFVFTSFAAIWDDVTLEARPDVYVDDVTVVTSVRQKTITVKAAVRNLDKTARDVEVGARAMDGAEVALDLGGQTTSVEPGRTTTFTFRRPWPDPKLWQPDSPHLYTMHVGLRAGADHDGSDTRFGFREVWVDGDRLLLNGVRVNLLGTARPGMSELFTREQVQHTMDVFRDANCRAIRLHANVWPKLWLDVADETGMLIIEEGAYWCCTDQYATEDPAFYDNFRKHWAGLIRRDKNHPSVVVHSIENELLLCAGPVEPDNKRLWDLEEGLADIGRYVKRLDPTRPIMFNGDDDPGGVADIVDLHYPHEPGRHALWPNEAYWLDGPTVIDNYPRNEWSWDKSKPLSVGEFQYNTGRRSAYMLFGDAYAADPQLADVAQGVTWRMQVEAFRAQDVAAMCPYTPWEANEMAEGPQLAAVRQAFEPNAAFVKEYDAHFFGGETVERTVDVYNDTMRAANLTLGWRMGDGPSGEVPVSLPPGEHKEVTLEMPMPAVKEVTAAPLTLTVTNGGKVVYEAEHPYWVCPRRAPDFGLAPATKVAVLKGDGRAEAYLRSGGVEPAILSDPAQIAGCGADVLVVEAHALDRLPAADVPVVGSKSGGPLVDFALAGGRAIVLEQDAYAPDIVPARLTGRPTNIAFARSQLGRRLSGGRVGWFQFWRGANLVSHNTIAKPSQGSFCVAVDAGGRGGLEDALLVAMPFGAGGITLCQLAVSEKLDTEPAAGSLLQGLVNQANAAVRGRRPVGLLGMDDDAQAEVGALGVVAFDVTDSFDATRHDDNGFVLAYAPAAHEHAQRLRGYVQSGGTVVLHGAQDAAKLSELIGRQAALREPEEGARLLLAGPDALTDGLSHADVQRLSGGVVTVAGGQALLQPASLVRVPDGRGCWIIDQVDWTGRTAGSAQAARYVSALLTNLGALFLPPLGRVVIPGTDLVGEGAEVSRYGDTVMLRASGTLGVTVRCASAGSYVFEVAGGRGRRSTGRPQVRLLLDGAALEEAGEGGALLTCRGAMSEGEHKLTLEYTAPEGAPQGGYGSALRVSSLTIQPE